MTEQKEIRPQQLKNFEGSLNLGYPLSVGEAKTLVQAYTQVLVKLEKAKGTIKCFRDDYDCDRGGHLPSEYCRKCDAAQTLKELEE